MQNANSYSSTHAGTQKERVPEKAESRESSMSFYFFTCPQGARTPGRPPHTIPGLPPHTPPVKNSPGGHPHLPQIIIIIIT